MRKLNTICPDCHGKGSYATSHEFVHCKMCNGSGKVKMKTIRQRTMRIIIIEGTVYRVTEGQFKDIQKISEINNDHHNDELVVSEYLEENKHNYTLLGEIDYDFRL